MFRTPTRTTPLTGFLAMLEVIFHAAVRNVRRSNRNAVMGLMVNILQSVVGILVFYTLFTVLKMRSSAVRGDFMIYSMTGIFIYVAHAKTMMAVAKSEGPTSAMMNHAPMNTIVAIASSALATLYLQLLSIAVILFFYNVFFAPVIIDQPIATLMMLLLAWASGIAVGVLVKSATPWAPEVFQILLLVYTRANLIASGKMFLANKMPTSKLEWFWWNPLFHIIDQTRGFVFLNYHPHFSNWLYPIEVTLALLVLGLMLENFTRNRASISWSAGR